jgi:hypothetical protein
MSASLPRPILVTGAHRSGTTWVGRMLAAARGVAYISEPFNVRKPPSPVKHFLHYVTDAEQETFRTYLHRLLTFRDPALYQVEGFERWVRRAARVGRCAWRRLRHYRPLVKDPIAFFSAEWLQRTFGMDVVVMVRHPAAFASSLRRLDSCFDFNELLAQPELVRDHLDEFRGEIRLLGQSRPGLIDQAILLWRMMYSVARRYQRRHPDWIFLRHEDVSSRPRPEFAALFARLGLDLTASAAQAIAGTSSANNPREARQGHAHDLWRDSRANVWSWVWRLTSDEIEYIRRETADVAASFYTDADWEGAALLGRRDRQDRWTASSEEKVLIPG